MTVALQTLNNVDERNSLLSLCGNLRLFRGYDMQAGCEILLTLNEFQNLREKKTLFRYGRNYESLILPRALQQSLEDGRVVLVSERIEYLLGNEDMPRCDERACVQVLLSTPLLKEPEHRVALVKALQNWSSGAQYEDFARAMRYLLHGRPDCLNSRYDLFAQNDLRQRTVWEKLVSSALSVRGSEWQLISRHLTEQIAEALWDDVLKLRRIDRNSAVQLLLELKDSVFSVDTQALTAEEREEAFRDIHSDTLLRKLALCQDLRGSLVSIDNCSPVYVSGTFEINPTLLESVTVLKRFEDDELASRQQRLVKVLDAEAALEIIFLHNDPTLHYDSALNALASKGETDLSPELCKAIREIVWVPLKNADLVAPGKVIFIIGVEDEIARVLDVTGAVYHSERSLTDEVLKHPGLDALREFFPNVPDSMEILLMAIEDKPEYYLGDLNNQSFDHNEFMTSFSEVFASASREVMPVYELVCGLYKARPKLTADLLFCPKGLFRLLTSKRNISVLNYLSKQHSKVGVRQRPVYKDMFDNYLRAASKQEGFFEYLSEIPLLNKQGNWCRPEALCLKADGVDQAVLIDESQGLILETNVKQIGHGEVANENEEHEPGEIPVPKGGFEKAFKEGAQKLAEYFRDWEEAVQGEVIGGFLCILGDQKDIVALAKDYLDRGNRTLENTRSLFEWNVLPGGIAGEGEDIHTAMSQQRFLIHITDDKTVDVPNLLGELIQAPLQQDFEHLFVGADLYFRTRLGAGIRVKQLNLKRINIAGHKPIDLRRALCNSANIILHRIYVQRNADTSKAFEALSKSEQLDICIAQDLILDHALPYLQQLGVHKEPKIHEILREWHAARRALAEERQQSKGKTQSQPPSDAAIQKVKRDFIELLRTDDDVRTDILSALRTRMDNHYQYKPNSVPFEIFQNADDAVVELRGMGAEDGSQTNRFGISIDHQNRILSFLHHGRLINQFRRGEFNGRDLGYDRDLEKMLVVSASDKGGEDTGETVTGKFGLGFKSVFLITDIPRVFSGPMAFDIVGGMLPMPITESPILLEQYDRHSTFFELRLGDKCKETTNILERFEKLGPVLLAFARAIRHIDLDIDRKSHSISWSEEQISGVKGAAIGTLMPFAHRVEHRQRALILRRSDGALLLGLNASGIEALDKEIPALWVTTPMRQAMGYGFALNGPFEVDVGRAQLAHESLENNRLLGELGIGFGQTLCNLFDHSDDWPFFCHVLNLVEEITRYDFWASLWSQLGLKLVSHLADEASSEAVFIQKLLWEDGKSVALLFKTRPACPSGLWGKYRVLTHLERVRFEIRGCLDTEDVFDTVSDWPELTRQIKPGEGISYSAISQPLKRLIGSQGWHSVGFSDLFDKEQQIDPTTARRFGKLVSEEFLRNLEEAEQERLREILGTFQFQGRDSNYHRGENLLIANDSNYDYRDEGMRAAFAPRDRVLSEEYADFALSFFKASRRILNARAVDMAKWVLNAKTKETRKAALDYLLNGELDSELARELRSTCAGTWLETLPEDTVLLSGFNDQEKRQLLANLWLYEPETVVHPDPDRYKDPNIVLPQISDWWQQEHNDRLAQYYEMTYPGGRPPKLSEDDLRRNIDFRRDWLIVLMLGVMQKIGRAQPKAHCNFLTERLQDGHFDIFADPAVDAERWMEVMKDFIDKEGEVIRYYHWMTQFAGFFQLAKWLHHYAYSFLSADRLGRKFALNHLLAPRTNPDFQGGGPDAPSLIQTLGIGAHFVVRELCRQDLITKSYVHPHCYMPGVLL